MHNADIMKALDIRHGDTLHVEKGGEIIPNSMATVSEPKPSMFIILRPTKCSILPTIWGKHPRWLGHIQAASPGRRVRPPTVLYSKWIHCASS